MFMRANKVRTIALLVLLVLIMVSVATALAASNNVPATRLSDQNRAVIASELAPPECSSIRAALVSIVVCTSTICNGSPGNTNELILGTSGSDTINGGNGDDCIVGGEGADVIFGDHGNDVLIGGPGADTLDGGSRSKDTDICIDDSDSTTFIDCETIQ